ncbi:PREDICTED: flap endonuclease GEN [Drosophila arizonae]|uniref:Flap endonuclease GEN n=1 Tax=Drosophila arizonae TaxID=7263 RepID=A0ABM1P494_DROAR|nr:PREDICTED: flap endonuclease GEN [Drosophila arizonae]
MGVKELWSILTPYADRKPICELRGKKVAIDLAGWVCESLNVVDYFVHPRHHLKNLFFRTCYLIWEQVTPVFVLEGAAPKLKSQVIAKRNELQFRGARPKDKDKDKDAVGPSQAVAKSDKGRTRFNHVLKQCENLLLSMGIQCVQGPGEAEAYCAFLNKHGLVDGVISQDSDCFAYGAVRVYRNFSVSTQGAQAAAGGAVDIYDMQEICNHMDFGQNKVIVMALLCGCDYCPDGIGGIGKDGVLKLFNKYKESDILDRLRNWRAETDKYNALELRVDDKSICSNCGHIGRTQSHTKSGCGVCRTHRGCDESLWKEQRLSIKAELTLRKKALLDVDFPNEEIISEFLTQPAKLPNLVLDWRQPNIVKFIKQIGHLLQWPEIYCFQKFFPLLTRWQVQQPNEALALVQPQEIIKKRTVKGIASLELRWEDTRGCFKGLIPYDQIEEFKLDHPKGVEELYYTVEPLDMLQAAYPDMVAAFIKSKEKPPKKTATRKKKVNSDAPLSALENLSDLAATTAGIITKPKRGKKKVPTNPPTHGQKTMQHFLKQKENTPIKSSRQLANQCSTPLNKHLPSDLESDAEFDMSDIINGIVSNPQAVPAVTKHDGYQLHYEPLADDLSLRLAQLSLDKHDVSHQQSLLIDDVDLLVQKRRDISMRTENMPLAKRYSLDDSFDLLVKGDLKKVPHLVKTPVERFKQQHRLSTANESKQLPSVKPAANVSYFFNQSVEGADAFEQLMESSLKHSEEDLVVISDSD